MGATPCAEVTFTVAGPGDAEAVAALVEALTEEICARTHARHFDIDAAGTVRRAREYLTDGRYRAVLGYAGGEPVAVATLAETHALYAAGRIGVVQEFYVAPAHRSRQVGARLLEEVRALARAGGCACIELCTPPLPEFERTVSFYEENGLAAVGGRKMRQSLERSER